MATHFSEPQPTYTKANDVFPVLEELLNGRKYVKSVICTSNDGLLKIEYPNLSGKMTINGKYIITPAKDGDCHGFDFAQYDYGRSVSTQGQLRIPTGYVFNNHPDLMREVRSTPNTMRKYYDSIKAAIVLGTINTDGKDIMFEFHH